MLRASQLFIAAISVAAMTAAAASSGRAFEIELPDVGTMINYKFNPPEFEFSIAQDVPSATAFSGEATFADEKALWKHPDPAYAITDFINLAIIFRGEGVKSALLDDFRRFDEYASLLGPDGTIIETAQNTSYGSSDVDDFFIFGWDFHTSGDLTIRSIEWQISPDVVAGEQLPPTLNIEAYLWGSPITVVPEPSAPTVAASCLLLYTFRRRNPAAQGA